MIATLSSGHLAMAHFSKFDEAAKRLVVSKSVTELQKVN